MRLFKRLSEDLRVDFCDRCGSVCDGNCQAEAVRREHEQAHLLRGLRVA